MFKLLAEKNYIFGVPNYLVLLLPISLFALIAQSYSYQPENFSILMFDYQYGFIRRGLLGEIANQFSSFVNYDLQFKIFYWVTYIALYAAVITLFWKAMNFATNQDWHQKVLFCIVILLTPLFLKNLFFDFGRFDSFGMAALFVFAIASMRIKQIMLLTVPTFLILCHEAQIFFTVVSMFTIYLIDAIARKRLFSVDTIIVFVVGGAISFGISLYFLLYGIPEVGHDVLSAYFKSKSPKYVDERAWLLYDNLKANIEMAAGLRRGYGGRQLLNAPVYIFVIFLHWPIIGILRDIYKNTSDQSIKMSIWLTVLMIATQALLFFISIDYARCLANIFITYIAVMMFILWKYDLSEFVVQRVAKHKYALIALALVFLPIPRFGIVSP